jgi:hypothetical protein
MPSLIGEAIGFAVAVFFICMAAKARHQGLSCAGDINV